MSLSKERKALLKQKSDDYIATMEAPGCGVRYSQVSTDRLLILEALNDWSGYSLAEGGSIKLPAGCDDPACASRYELTELVGRMHTNPVVFYPVSGFTLGDADQLRFGYADATYRMTPESNGSRMDAIMIAEASHIRDVDAAMSLWAMCATEDCIAYLSYQMNEHNLYFEDDELAATRQIITSALLTNFSVGQVWNAIWRSVRDAAALSARPYYNVAKASKTIPKKIDKVLTQHIGTRKEFSAYERLASLPMGAVLTLLLNRFGIKDDTPGPEVRAVFASDAALAPPVSKQIEDTDDEGRALVCGTFFFTSDITSLDRLLLSCFDKLRTDEEEPEWDENHVVGRLHFMLGANYAFNGFNFFLKFLDARGVPEPTPDDLERHAEAARQRAEQGSEWEDLTGRRGLLDEFLIKSGVNPDDLGIVRYPFLYSATPEEVMGMFSKLSGEKGLRGIRSDYAQLYDDYAELSSGFYTGDFSFQLPEERLEPEGCDSDLLLALAGNNIERLASLVATSISRSVNATDTELKRQLLLRVGQLLVEQGTPPSLR